MANRPTFGCPSTCHIIVTIGERATWQIQKSLCGSSVSKKPVLFLHIKDDLRPCWSNEEGRLGSGTPLVTVQEFLSKRFARNRACWGHPMDIPQEGIQDIPPSSVLFSDKRHAGSHPGDFLFCPASSALQGPLRWYESE